MSKLSKISLLSAFAVLVACSNEDPPSSSSSGSSGASSSSSSSGGTSSGSTGERGGSCTGEITACAMGTLSDRQQDDMCSLILASIDASPGTKFECKEGEQEGLFLTVSSKTECVASKAPSGCKLTVGQLVQCYKAASKDACASFAEGGACAPLFDPGQNCVQ
jgi:hypothetical protein